MNEINNPYSPPSAIQSNSGNDPKPGLARILATPVSALLIVILAGVPIFVCLSLAWIAIKAARIIHFNFFVLPGYNPFVTCAITMTILVLFVTIRVLNNYGSNRI